MNSAAKPKYPPMRPKERAAFSAAVAEERIGPAANVSAARPDVAELLAECKEAVAVLRRFRQAREAAGVSLAELEARTELDQTQLAELESSKVPNPTLSTLQRYAAAIGKSLDVDLR